MLSQQKASLEFHPTQPIAHRGNFGKNRVPENTLAAVKLAHKQGAKWVECDVKLTADNVIIVIHDDTLRRTTNAEGEIADTSIAKLTYAQIEKFDAGSKISPRFAGEKIPTLIQYLNLIKKLNLGLLLEIKPSPGADIETARKTIEILYEYNLINYPNLLVQSFSVEALREVKRLSSALNLGFIIEVIDMHTKFYTGVLDVLRELNCKALVAYHPLLTLERIALIKEVSPYVLAWTVDDPKRGSELFIDGVDAVISDHPERFMAARLQKLLASPFSFFDHSHSYNQDTEKPLNLFLINKNKKST